MCVLRRKKSRSLSCFTQLEILSHKYNSLWTPLLLDIVSFSRGFGSQAYFYHSISRIILVYWAFIMLSSSIMMQALVIVYFGFMKRDSTIRIYPVYAVSIPHSSPCLIVKKNSSIVDIVSDQVSLSTVFSTF